MNDTNLLYDIEQDTRHNVNIYSPKSNSSSNLSLSPQSAQMINHRNNLIASPGTSRSPSSERLTTTSNDIINVLNGKKEVIPQRKRRDFIPNELKDEHYWERRRKNNLAAKRSREKRRLNDIVLETKVIELTNLNNVYKLKLDLLMKKYNVDDNEMDKLFEENRHLLVVTETIEGMLDDDTSQKLVNIKTSSSSASSNGNTSDHSCDDHHNQPPPNKILKSTTTTPTTKKELLINHQYPLLYNQLSKTMSQKEQDQNDQPTKIVSSIQALNDIENNNNSQLLLNNQIEKYRNLINKINANANARILAINNNNSRKRLNSNDYLNDNSLIHTQSTTPNSILMENINRLFLLNQHLHNTALKAAHQTEQNTNTSNAFNQTNTNSSQIDSNMPLKLRFKMLQLKAGEVN